MYATNTGSALVKSNYNFNIDIGGSTRDLGSCPIFEISFLNFGLVIGLMCGPPFFRDKT